MAYLAEFVLESDGPLEFGMGAKILFCYSEDKCASTTLIITCQLS